MTTQALTRDLSLLDRDVIGWRRDLHQDPGLGFDEQRSIAFVAEQLAALGLDIRTKVGQTSVIADLYGSGAGPMLLIRADMDALPIQDRANEHFSSRALGVMHACGHDAQVGALLGDGGWRWCSLLR
jgi:metal-dependent amidase/aminoacylase/carboxypeptidase family protein